MMASSSAAFVNPSRHVTVAPYRSFDALADIVEIRGDVDTR